MNEIKVYCPTGKAAPMHDFLSSLDQRLRDKLLWQIFCLQRLSPCELREPHYKHFSLEKYSSLYELREKGKILVRIIFTLENGNIILLVPFVKRQPRDTMKALEQSLRILSRIRASPEFLQPFRFQSKDAT